MLAGFDGIGAKSMRDWGEERAGLGQRACGIGGKERAGLGQRAYGIGGKACEKVQIHARVSFSEDVQTQNKRVRV